LLAGIFDVWCIVDTGLPPPERSVLLERCCIWCNDASVTVDDLYFSARLLVTLGFCGWLLLWKILLIFLYCDWLDDTELYFLDEIVLSTVLITASEQRSSLPDEAEEELDVISAIPLPPEPPSGGDLGGCK
jgi:hypothetical protein